MPPSRATPHPPTASAAGLGVLLALVLVACRAGGTAAPASPNATPEASAAASAAEPSEPSQAASPSASPSPGESAGGGPELAVSEAEDVGEYVVDPDGHTLYIFTNDSPGTSTCTDTCAANWPPFTLSAGEEAVAGEGISGTLATIEREDGTRQVTLDGWPLYYFAADDAPGDTNGEAVGGVWFVARPDGSTPADEDENPDENY